MPATDIAQTDENSQGTTQTEVPDVEDTSPMEGETVYGSFIALAESGFPGPSNSVTPDTTSRVSLTIRRSGGGAPIHVRGNVDNGNGVQVKRLAPGTYTATWRLTDAHGDTRTVATRFIEQPALRGARPGQGVRPKVACKLTGSHHHKLACQVTFRRRKAGTVRMRITKGGHPYALGHGRIRNGTAVLTMRQLRRMGRGTWKATLVVSGAHQKTETFRETIRVK